MTLIEILKNLEDARQSSPNGALGHFAGLFGTGFLGTVHSVMTSYYESLTGGGATSGTLGTSSPHYSSSGSTPAPNLSDIVGNEFDLTTSETSTLSDLMGNNESLTLADVIAN